MSCRDLINDFRKTGGKMECRYDTRKCFFLPQKKEGNIMNDNVDDLDKLVWDFGPKIYKFMTNIPVVDKTTILPKLHKYQNENNLGFVIEFSNPYIYQSPISNITSAVRSCSICGDSSGSRTIICSCCERFIHNSY